MKKLLIIILLVGLISITSAIDLDVEEPYTFDLGEQYAYYSIIGNSTFIDITITQNETFVTVIIGKYTQSDTFDLIFYNIKDEEIYHSGGGGGRKSTKVVNETVEDFTNGGNYPRCYSDGCYYNKVINISNETIIEDVEEVVEEENKWRKILIVTILILLIIYFIIVTVEYWMKLKK